MATRKNQAPATRQNQAPAAPQQQRGVVGRQQRGVGNSRRALEDIGNVVDIRPAKEGKPFPQVTRRITRNFGAQLLLNAQAAVAVDADAVAIKKNPKKPDIPKPEEAQQEGKQKANPETQPEPAPIVVIEVPSTSSKGSRRTKTVHTLTSVLTARSKDACGIKDKETVEDIDASDVDDELAVVEYVEDLYKYYKFAEDLNRPRNDYLDSQPELNAKMRSILVDWLIEVHHKFDLTKEALYLTINLIDRYLSVETVIRRELQLVGISAMLIACKYEEIWAPEVNDFICISDRAYTRERILGMEKAILNKLEWYITVPTPYMFIVRFLKACQPCDNEMENMVFFFAELSLLHYRASVKFPPSMLAAAVVYAARSTLNRMPLWTTTLKHHSGYSTAELHDCATLLVTLHSNLAESKLKVVKNKYSSPVLGSVALRSPAKNLLGEASGSSAGSSS